MSGQPVRSAVTDANAGVVNPPQARQSTSNRAVQVQGPQTAQLDAGIARASQGLGNALQGFVNKAAQNMDEQKALDAAIRQGSDEAVNNTDLNNKRTGWKEAVFGQDAGYRQAQQRAVQNSINANYLEAANALDEHAGESPEEYQQTLKDGLDELLKPHANDPETRKLITATWGESARKLASKQYEAHDGWNQIQNRETVTQGLRQGFDTMQVDMNLANTPEEMVKLREIGMSLFNSTNRPQGMEELAFNTVVREEVQNSLRDGNIMPYNLAKQAGFDKDFNEKERKAWDTAVGKYDTRYNSQGTRAVQQYELAMVNAKDLQQAENLAEEFIANVDTLETRQSGTDKSKETISRIRLQGAKIYQRLVKSAATEEVKEDRIGGAMATFSESPLTREGTRTEANYTKKELEGGFDRLITETVSEFIGEGDNPSVPKANQAILTNPELAKQIAGMSKNTRVASPFLKDMFKTVLSSASTMVDENTGRGNEVLTTAMASIAQFEIDSGKFKTIMGGDDYDRYLQLKRGLAAKLPIETIEAKTAKFFENKGKLDQWSATWPVAGRTGKRDRIEKLMNSFTKDEVDAQSISGGMEEYNKGLLIHNGDHDLAAGYLKVSVQNAAMTYQGRTIAGGAELDKQYDHNFQSIMDYVQGDSRRFGPLITTLTGGQTDADGNAITSLDKVDNWSMFTVPGRGGVYLTAPNAIQPVHVTDAYLEDSSRRMTQLERQKDDAALAKKLKDHKTSQIISDANKKAYQNNPGSRTTGPKL